VIAARSLLLSCLLAFVVAGCRTGGAASPSPPGFDEVFSELARRGATVTQIVSGAPGCDDPSLVANAVRLTIRLADGVPRTVHLFGFRNAAALRAASANLEQCRRSFEASAATGSVGAMTSAPYYAFGAPWSPELATLLEEVAAPDRSG
jgi:hypothetical protein